MKQNEDLHVGWNRANPLMLAGVAENCCGSEMQEIE